MAHFFTLLLCRRLLTKLWRCCSAASWCARRCALLYCAMLCNLHAAVSVRMVCAHLLTLCLPDVSLPAAQPTPHILTTLPMCEQEQLARGQRGVAEQVFAGTYPHQPYKPLTELLPEGKVDLSTFLYMSSLVSAHRKLRAT